MTKPIALRLNGADLAADPAGVLLWPARRTLVVADLHLEKGSGFACRGVLLPPFDSTATLTRLKPPSTSRSRLTQAFLWRLTRLCLCRGFPYRLGG